MSLNNNFTLWTFSSLRLFLWSGVLCLCLVCDKRILYKMPDEIGEKRRNNDITMANLPVLGDVY